MHVMDASPAMFSYFTLAEVLARCGCTVYFNGLRIDTYDIAEVEMVVLDRRSIWYEMTVTIMPVGDEPHHMVTKIRVDESDTDAIKETANECLHAALVDGPLDAVEAAGSISGTMHDLIPMRVPELEEK